MRLRARLLTSDSRSEVRYSVAYTTSPFIYKRLILASKENGARTNSVGRALHKKLTYHSWEGTSLLKFVYG